MAGKRASRLVGELSHGVTSGYYHLLELHNESSYVAGLLEKQKLVPPIVPFGNGVISLTKFFIYTVSQNTPTTIGYNFMQTKNISVKLGQNVP